MRRISSHIYVLCYWLEECVDYVLHKRIQFTQKLRECRDVGYVNVLTLSDSHEEVP